LYEVFLYAGFSGEADHASSEGLGRMASLSLQNGIEPIEIAKSWRRIQGGDVAFFRLSLDQEKPYKATSIPSAVAAVVEHLIGDGKLLDLRKLQAQNGVEAILMVCKHCGEAAVQIKPGEECSECLNCGNSVCT